MRTTFFILLTLFVASCSEKRVKKVVLSGEAQKEVNLGFDSVTVRQGLEKSYLFDFMREKRIRSQFIDWNDTTTEVASSNIWLGRLSDTLHARAMVGQVMKCKAYMAKDTIYIDFLMGMK